MKNKFILLLAGLSLCVFIVLAFVSNYKATAETKPLTKTSIIPDSIPSTIEGTVLNYCIFAKEGNVSKINELITSAPDSYLTYLLNENSDKSDKSGGQTSIIDRNGTIVLSPEARMKGFKENFGDIIYQSLVYDYPQIIRKEELVFEKIIDRREKDNDARISVTFRSKDNNPFYQKLTFYLHKEDNMWKIFKIMEDFLTEDFLN